VEEYYELNVNVFFHGLTECSVTQPSSADEGRGLLRTRDPKEQYSWDEFAARNKKYIRVSRRKPAKIQLAAGKTRMMLPLLDEKLIIIITIESWNAHVLMSSVGEHYHQKQHTTSFLPQLLSHLGGMTTAFRAY